MLQEKSILQGKSFFLLVFTMCVLNGNITQAIVQQASETTESSLASVNGVSISEKMVSLAEGRNVTLKRNKSFENQQALQKVIHLEMLAQEAENQKLDQDPDFEASLIFFRKQMLANYLLDKNINRKISLSDLKKYYQQHQDFFNTDQVYFQYILVKKLSDAQEIHQKMISSANNFKKLAEKIVDASKNEITYGEGWLTRFQMPYRFVQTVFTSSLNEISNPIETPFGFYIVKVLKKNIGNSLSFHEVETQVKLMLKQQLIENYVNQLKVRSTIKYHDE